MADVLHNRQLAIRIPLRKLVGKITAMSVVLVVAACVPVGGQAAAADGIGGPLPVQPTFGQGVTDRVLVRFAPTADRGERSGLRRLAGIRAGGHVGGVPGLEIATVKPGQSVALATAALNASEEVVYAEPDAVRHVAMVPDDEFFHYLWGLDNTGQDPDGPPQGTCPYSGGCAATSGVNGADIDAPEAWDAFPAGAALVAVADTGIDDDHEDLDGSVWTNPIEAAGNVGVDDDGNGYTDDLRGWDWAAGTGVCSSGDNNPDPPDWSGLDEDRGYHGTHVASTIGAERNNSVGIAGVNPGSGLMALRIGGTDGLIYASDELCAISYAANNGAKVFNGSYGGYSQSLAVTNAIAASPQMLFVFAAGNDTVNVDRYPTYPCATPAPNVICVGASNNFEETSWFSNRGVANVDLMAPGEMIAGAFNDSSGSAYVYLDGTSMATPHVAGAASLIMARYPTLGVADVKQSLLSGVDQRASFTCNALTGGRLNLNRSLDVAASIAAGSPNIPQLTTCPSSGTSPGGGDVNPPIVALLGSNKAKLRRTAAFSFVTWCDELCTFTYSVRIPKIGTINGTGSAPAGTAQKVRVVPKRAIRRKLLKALRRRHRRAVVTVLAKDAAGNQSVPARLTMTLRR